MKHTARKRFGQHFLTDAYVLGAIVDLIDPQPGQALVEIGPGLGALTWPVLQRCGSLTVIELDRDLATRLRRRGGNDRFRCRVALAGQGGHGRLRKSPRAATSRMAPQDRPP